MEIKKMRSPLGYIKWLRDNENISLENWKLEEVNGLVCLVNEADNLAVRGEVKTDGQN